MKGKLLTVVLILVGLFVAVNKSYACPAAHAILHISPVNIFPGHSVTLDGSYSYPDIVEYTWWDGSGWSYTETEGSAPDGAFDGVTTHTYTSIRWHVVWLSVKTQYGKTDTTFGAVRVVKIRNMTSGSGYDNIQDALDYANEGHTIMVLPGTYTENLDFTDKEITLTSTEPDNPDVVARTIIDGGSSNRVITFGSGDADSTITGFTITSGYATGSGEDRYGGGIYCNGVSPTITNCIITGNEAVKYGGGIYCNGGSPAINNCVIEGNVATDDGGGMYNDSSAPTITNCIFAGNQATSMSDGYGGGMYNYASSPELVNCVFSDNYAGIFGGGMCNYSSNNLKLTNCTFQANEAVSWGGGMLNVGSSPTVVNCIFWENIAFNGNTEQQQIYGGSPSVTYSCIQDADPDQLPIPFGGAENDNIDDDPYFVNSSDPAGPDRLFGTLDDGLTLSVTNNSGCIDTGSNSAVVGVSYDIIGNARKMNGDYIGDPDVDRGAYEVPRIWYVNYEKNGDGKSWTNAFYELKDALDSADDGDEIWVADGTYKPYEGSNPEEHRSDTFQLIGNVGVYGGFAGTEKGHYYRNWTANVTTLSGDIHTSGSGEDDSYHVVKVPDGADGAVLDGFIITKGDADGSGDDADGAGIYCDSVSFTLGNCAIIDNHCIGDGGGMYCEDSSVTVSNCVFADNTAEDGAGVFNLRYSESGESCPVFTNCVFSENVANIYHGYGGGLFLRSAFYPISARLTNCTFYGNQAYHGGGMINHLCNNMPVSNCIFWGNTATVSSQIFSYYEYDGCKPTFSYCDIEDSYIGNGYVKEDGTGKKLGSDGGGNIDADPDFDIDEYGPVGEDGVWATTDDGLMLGPDSACINVADYYATPRMDITGRLRTDVSANPDMGAYESGYKKVIVVMCFIDETLTQSYYDDEVEYDDDLGAYNDLLASLPINDYSIIKAGCIVPPFYEEYQDPEDENYKRYKENIADVLPDSFFYEPDEPFPPDILDPGEAPVYLPAGLSVAKCSRPPSVEELFAHFHRIRDGLVPDCVIILADGSPSLGGFYGPVLYGTDYENKFEPWLKHWLKYHGLEPESALYANPQYQTFGGTGDEEFRERWIAGITREINDFLTPP